MNKSTTELITKDSYWDVVSGDADTKENFLFCDWNRGSLDSLSINDFTRCLALQFQQFDEGSKYGLEIKSNGSSRSGRIPLVRFNTSNPKIFKVVNTLSDVDKGVQVLTDLLRYISSCNKHKKILPETMLIVRAPESEYIKSESNVKYIKNIVMENNIAFMSLDYVFNYLKDEKDLNELFSENGKVLTNISI